MYQFTVNDGQLTECKFDTWMKAVDKHCVALCGLESADLPDYCYADAYDDGLTPKQAAKAAIRAANGDE